MKKSLNLADLTDTRPVQAQRDLLATVTCLERGNKDLLLRAGSSCSQAIHVGWSLHVLDWILFLPTCSLQVSLAMLSPDATTWLMSSIFGT